MTTCKCTHSLNDHGIQNGCIFCKCRLTRDGVTQAERIKKLETEFRKMSIRVHALSCIYGVSEHHGTFSQCTAPHCRDAKTFLATGGAS